MLTVLTYKHHLTVISSGRRGEKDEEQQKKLKELSKVPRMTAWSAISHAYVNVNGMDDNCNYNLFLGLLGFWTLSIVQYSKILQNTTKLDLFLSSRE
jgi:hypothetical protein